MMATTANALPTLAQLLEGMAIAPPVPVSDVVADSRAVIAGSVFLALAGRSHHGMDFADTAIANGAIAIVTDLEADDPRVARLSSLPVISVPDRQGLDGVIAARFFGAPTASMDVIAVTGTNGKSSVSWLVGHAMRNLGRRAALMGTLGWGPTDDLVDSVLTTPDAVTVQRQAAAMLDARCEVMALEASSHALDQYRLSGTHINVAVFTNLTRDHLDYHGSMQNYFEAKAQLFDWPGLGARVIAVDDEWGRELAGRYPDAWQVGAPRHASNGRSVQIVGYAADAQGVCIDVVTPLGAAQLKSALMGRFNVQNLALALAVLLAQDVPLQHAVDALGGASAPPGRLQRVSADLPPTIVDYAHTPAGIAEAINAVREHTDGRLWCVFGCGGDRDRGKRPEMARAAQAADVLVLTSDNPRNESPQDIIDDMLPGVGAATHHVIVERAEAIEFAINSAAPNDTVLIAGKGHERYQVIGSEVREFDDVQVARDLLVSRRGLRR